MGPIPSLTHATPLPALAPLAGPARVRPEPAETRPVELPSDQVLPVPDETRGRLEEDLLRTSHEQLPDERTPVPEGADRDGPALETPLPDAPATMVAYRVHPDLQRALQGNVIDVETDEVLRAIPSEDRIRFQKAFREHLGTFLDTTA